MLINNNPNANVNFRAKMLLAGKLKKDLHWKSIAKKFEAQTAKFPEYEMEVYMKEPGKLVTGTNRGDFDTLNPRYFTLTSEGFSKLMKLSDDKIVQKFKKLLNLVKKQDKHEDTAINKIFDMGKKLGIELDSKTIDGMEFAMRKKVKTQINSAISKDSVLSHSERYPSYRLWEYRSD